MKKPLGRHGCHLKIVVEEVLASDHDEVRHMHDFALAPASWYYMGTEKELAQKPVRFLLPGGQEFVGFRTENGRLSVLAARCSHMGADLSKGCVVGEKIACPLHGWEYGHGGGCERIPVGAEIPAFARQAKFPVEERGGHVFFFNRAEARFPMPFFDGVRPDQLLAARAFEFIVDAPWYLVGGNGFDFQHFRCAHDRTLAGEPEVSTPDPFAWQVSATFAISGTSMFDHFTRWYSGEQVKMTVTNWGGNLVLVSAAFRRTTSYGLVSFVPLENGKTLVRDIVWVPRRNGLAGRLIDPLDAEIRRFFIREFVRSDVDRSEGIRYSPGRMIAADKVLVDYLDWLQKIHR